MDNRVVDPASSFPMPSNLVAAAEAEGRGEWLGGVRAIVEELARRWDIDVGPPFQPGGQTAWTASARNSAGDDLVLKVGWRHMEAEHEGEGLRLWAGHGTVLLYERATYPDTIAFLIERCRPGTPLAALPQTEQDVVVAELLRRLWKVPPSDHRFRPLQAMCDFWAEEFERKVAARGRVIDPGLANEGMRLWRALPSTADRSVLLCTDLHADNVLTAAREPWLVIDPKPFVGDPTYDALQHILNCADRLHADPLGLVRRMAGLLDLDAGRLALWLFARCVQESPDWPALLEVARRIRPN